MRDFTDRQLSIGMRVLLVIVALGFAAFLVVLNLIRIASEVDLPEYAHLGIPVYIGVLLGFVPVYVAIERFWRIARHIGDSRSITAALLQDIRIIRNCALVVAGWFTVGLLLFFATFRVIGPPPIVAWLFIELATLSVAVVATVVLRLLRSAADD